MVITQKHKLYSKKVNKDFVVVQLSDLHYNDFTDLKKLIAITNKIANINPDYIIFCGDIFFSKSISYNNLLQFFYGLSAIAPIFITYGNHDVMTKDNNKDPKKLEWIEYVETEVLDKLKNMRNVQILDNESTLLKDFNVLLTGINMDFYHYEVVKENAGDFVYCLNKMFTDVQDPHVFNEISCHSPLNILNPEHFAELNVAFNADLIHCGHMHNGLVPLGAGICLPKNRGIIDPHGNLYPKLARGEVRINGALGIIGGPITTLAENQGSKATFINGLCPSRIDQVLVKKMH